MKESVFARSIKKASSVQRSIEATAAGVSIPQLIHPSRIRVQKQIRGKANPGFKREALLELAADIEKNGQIQAATVIPDPEGISEFLLVAGERRKLACELGNFDLLAVVRNLTWEEARRVQISENLQREDLTQAEVAEAVKDDYDRLGTLEQVAELWTKSINWIHERLKFVEAIEADGVAKEAVTAGVTGDVSTINEIAKLEKRDVDAAKQVVDAAKADPSLNVRQAVRNAIKQTKQTKQAGGTTQVGGNTDSRATQATASDSAAVAGSGRGEVLASRASTLEEASGAHSPRSDATDVVETAPSSHDGTRDVESAGAAGPVDDLGAATRELPNLTSGDEGALAGDSTLSLASFAKAVVEGEAAVVRKLDGLWVAETVLGSAEEKFGNLEDLLLRLAAVGLTKIEVECPVAFA
ncbi:ParB/RepB/Spo0J family partition protein (plasmid) [Burkholderia aenigmatica]|uniref:ParB/RepB/Spo0J family partition protein n=1 Tax=Burkholderia aenigmatica TaxID=2015348 RepID=UPI003B4396C5